MQFGWIEELMKAHFGYWFTQIQKQILSDETIILSSEPSIYSLTTYFSMWVIKFDVTFNIMS